MNLSEWLDEWTVPGPDGCRLWIGHKLNNGYGGASLGGYRTTAHRVAVLRDGRKIPAGYEIDHLCRVKLCVNPDHLEIVTRSENMRRASSTTLTHDLVRDIKSRFIVTGCPRGFAAAEARRLGVTGRSIELVLSGDRWDGVGHDMRRADQPFPGMDRDRQGTAA